MLSIFAILSRPVLNPAFIAVDFQGAIVLDKYVRPTMEVVDYRETTTGIKQWQLFSSMSCVHCAFQAQTRTCAEEAVHFSVVQQFVATMMKNKIIVGHSIWNDLSGTSFSGVRSFLCH
jgi:RNA exonuclease 4